MGKVNQNSEIQLIEQGKRLKKCLEYTGITQKQLAERMHVTPQYVSGMINGKKRITADSAVTIAESLGVNFKYLLLKSNYMTMSEWVYSEVSQEPCFDFIQALGYTVQGLDNNHRSMHRPYCQITINKDIEDSSRNDSDAEILRKAHDAVPVRVYVVTDPTGRKMQLTQSELMGICDNLREYAHFQFSRY